jgi:hypothetical protein
MATQRIPGSCLTGASTLPIETIRCHLHEILQDCKDIRTQQLIYHINVARTAADLWLLRTEMQRCISHLHGPAIASERTDMLISLFEA